jgi:tRNA-dihydrouridine synthase 3
MVGRGGLIKPWIFTEIKEHREWDISSRERLELIRKVSRLIVASWKNDSSRYVYISTQNLDSSAFPF